MSDWPEIRISELATIDIGGTPSRAIPAFWSEKPSGFPWISIADLKGKYVSDTKERISALGVRSSNVKLIPELTTVMSFKLTVGRTAITATDMYCNEAIALFQPRDDRLDARWLYHALPRAAGSVVTDTAVKGATLNKAKMAEMLLQLPPSAEQAIIARVLDTLDTAIHETEAIIAKLKAVKQGLLHDLLTRGINANGELRPPQSEAPHLYKQSPLGWIPKEWDAVPLGKLARDAYRYPSYFGIGYVETGVPEVRGECIQSDGTLRDSTGAYRYVSDRTAAQFPRVRLKPGDLVMTVRGTIGKFALVPDWLEGAVITANLLKLSLDAAAVDASWLLHLLLSSAFQDRLDAACSATTIRTIQVPALLKILVSTPPSPEQKEVHTRLSAIDRRLALELVELEKLKLEKLGLMDDLLTGRVRVTPLLAAAPEGRA